MDSNDSLSFSHIEGYDFEFDPPLDKKYECPICLSTLREPRQTSCGHRFCRECILRWLRDPGKRCPIDNEMLSENEVYPDNFARREILNFQVKCSKAGCEVRVPLNKFQAHIYECPMTLRPCPYSCTSILPQKEMKEHVERLCQNRLVICPLCDNKLRANQLGAHAMTCPKAPVPCSYCNEKVTKDEMEMHITNQCQRVVVPCPFHLFGCDTVNERGQESNHLTDDVPSHLKQMSHTMSSLLHGLGNVAAKISHTHQDQNLSQSAWASEICRSLSQLKINSCQHSPSSGIGLSLQSSFSDQLGAFSLPLEERNWPNLVNRYSQSPSINHSLETSPQNVFFESNGNQQTSLPYSLPVVRTPRSIYDEKSDKRNAAPASAPQSTSENPDHPFFEVYSLPQNNSTPLPQNSNGPVSANTDNNNHFNQNSNHFPPSSASPDITKFQDLPSAGHLQGQPSATGMDKINSFVNGLHELCIGQSKGLLQQQQVIEQMYHQLCQLTKSNQELVKQVRDFESRRLHFDTRSHCGDFYWRISDYGGLRKRASNGETSIIHSSPFLTGPWGYKLCIRANISGFVNRDNEHYLSLFIHFMQGSNDSLLKWPFKGQIILSVIDQKEAYSNRVHITETLEAKPQLEAFKRPITARNHKGFGFTEFVNLSTLENDSYIQNDTVIVRAQIFPET